MKMTMAQLADELYVDRRQIHTWFKRRDRNGFPEPIDERPLGTDGRVRYLWELLEVKRWRESYTPRAGGRPSQKKLS